MPPEDMNKEHIVERLLKKVARLVKETEIGTREYELAVTNLVSQDVIDHLKNKEILDRLLKEIDKNIHDKKFSFTLFFIIFTFHRRVGNYRELTALINNYEREFRNIPFLWHLKAMACKSTNEIKKSLEAAYKAIKDPVLRKNPGVLHNFAESVVEAFEWGEIKDGITLFTDQFTSEQLLKMAEEYLNKAIQLDEYPKFYITLGRLYIIKGEFKQAGELIIRGVSLEDPSEKDYSLRVSKYMAYLHYAKLLGALKNELKELKDELGQELEQEELKIMNVLEQEKLKILEAISKEKSKNLEILAIFTAIIGFLVTTDNISTSLSNSPSAMIRLLFLLGGVLLLFVFAPIVLDLVIFNREKLDKASIATVIIMILIALVFVVIGGWR